MQSDSWKEFKNCKGLPIDMFFERYEKYVEVQLEVDKVCNSCVVRQQCLEYAIDNDLIGGVFGGRFMTEKFLARKKKQRKVNV